MISKLSRYNYLSQNSDSEDHEYLDDYAKLENYNCNSDIDLKLLEIVKRNPEVEHE